MVEHAREFDHVGGEAMHAVILGATLDFPGQVKNLLDQESFAWMH